MIDFELSDQDKLVQQMVHAIGESMFRPISRKYDSYEHEHDEKEELIEVAEMLARGSGATSGGEEGSDTKKKSSRRGLKGLTTVVAVEELCWGDVGLTLAIPGNGLGNAAINAVGTPDQKKRLGKKYTAMAITEPGCGSDTASIKMTAELDEGTNEWILNGEKIFITGGGQCEAVVVWATLDITQGRPAIKSFVVEKGTPGCTLSKLEDKLGIRASDTAAIVFEDCRIPYDNLLGTAEIVAERGFTGVMQTFDNTRPMVAAQALGVARAALEFTKAKLEEGGCTFDYDQGQQGLTAVQRDVFDMEANLDAARLLTWRAASLTDRSTAATRRRWKP